MLVLPSVSPIGLSIFFSSQDIIKDRAERKAMFSLLQFVHPNTWPLVKVIGVHDSQQANVLCVARFRYFINKH